MGILADLRRPSHTVLAFWTVTILFISITVVWLFLNRAPPQWDDSFYLTHSLNMFDALVEGGLLGYAKKFLTVLGTKPPLITVLPTPVYLVLGRNPQVAYAVNLVSMLTLLAAVYCIGSRYWNRRVGLVAVYITGTMPLLYGLARWYLVDFTLTALVCLTLSLLTATSEVNDYRKTLLCGFTCGLGMLTKVTFLLYVSFPILWVSFRQVRKIRAQSHSPRRELSPWLNWWLALLAPTLGLALPWYLVNFRAAFDRILISGFSGEADVYGTGPVFSSHAIKIYLINVVNAGPSFYYVCLTLLLLSLVVLTSRYQCLRACFPKEILLILSLWSLPFLVFMFGRNKDLRFIAPILPVFSLILAPLLDLTLKELNRWRNPLLFLFLTFPLVSLFHISFGLFGNWNSSLGPFLLAAPRLVYAEPYDPHPWPHLEILKIVCRSTECLPREKKRLMLGSDRARFNADNFGLVAVQARLPLLITTSAYETDLSQLLSTARSMSFFVYKEGGEPESGFFNRHVGALLREVQTGGYFAELPCNVTLPDGGRVHVYKNRGF
jgi:4-amino-4-deoxy-L-arabinose transferase-like glycosyltransferase